jgi:hypothetical protein
VSEPTERRARWIRLRDEDNVVVLTRHVEPGEILCGPLQERWAIDVELEPGHKLAGRAIAPGERVFKDGFPIGVATSAIAGGEHVHTHNLRSCHIPLERE